MDDQPFEVKTEHGPLISIPNTAGLNDIPMMIVQDHTAAEFYDRCMGNFERLSRSPGALQIKYFEQVLDEISKHDDVALWTDGQVAD